MTNEKMEQRLASALEKTAPDDVSGVLSRCEVRKGTVSSMKANHTIKKKWATLVAACLAVILLGGGGVLYQQANAAASVVSLDVNHSIELRVSWSEKVLACAPLNEDAKAILADMGGGADLKGAKLDVAVNAIVGSLVRNGYLSSISSAIMISVEELKDLAEAGAPAMPIGKDKALSIAAAAFSRDLADEIRYSEVDAELDESPAQYEVEITGQKGEEIEYKIDAYTGTILESKRETEEKASAAQPTASGDIGHAKAKAIALNHAGVSESKAYDMEIELDEEDGMLVYEVEFKSGGMEYSYEINAATGAIVKQEAELDR